MQQNFDIKQPSANQEPIEQARIEGMDAPLGFGDAKGDSKIQVPSDIATASPKT